MTKTKCYAITSFDQINEIIKNRKNDKKITIIYLKYSIIDGFGIDWLETLLKIYQSKIRKNYIRFYVDCNNNFGLSIMIMKKGIDYIKLKSNPIILNKINQIARKNKVVLNPNFDVVDLSKIKNLKKEFE